MNTMLQRIKRPALVSFLVLIALFLQSQNRNDSIYFNNSDIIKQHGKSVYFNTESKALIQDTIRKFVNSYLSTMQLREENAEDVDPMYFDLLKSYFDEQVIIKNEPAFPNFFQPRACLDTTVFPAYYSVQTYCDSAVQWFDYIEITKESDILPNDYYFKFRGKIYTNALVSVRFNAPSQVDCSSIVDTSFKLNLWFTMSKQRIIYKSGAEVPIAYKLRFLEIQPEFVDTVPAPKYKNMWSFVNLNLHGGVSSASFKTLSDYNDLLIEPAAQYGALASFTLFASDTFTVFNKVRPWEYGLDIGVGYDHLAWNWKLDSYESSAEASVSPLNDLSCTQTLVTRISSLTEKKTFDVLTVPLTLTLKRYLSPRKVNSVFLNAGVSFNYLLNNATEITSGTVSYTGENCSFQDPQSGEWIEGVTIDNLPYYGYGTYKAVLNSSDKVEYFEPYYLAVHLKLGLDLRKERYSRLHWIIAPYFNYSFTELRSGNNPEMIIKPAGEISDISAVATSLKPFSFGIGVGISYNVKQNSLKNIRVKK